MHRPTPARLWFEAVTAAAGLTMFVLTLITREWVEVLTGTDPDRGSGGVEIAVSVAVLAISLTAMLATGRDVCKIAHSRRAEVRTIGR